MKAYRCVRQRGIFLRDLKAEAAAKLALGGEHIGVGNTAPHKESYTQRPRGPTFLRAVTIQCGALMGSGATQDTQLRVLARKKSLCTQGFGPLQAGLFHHLSALSSCQKNQSPFIDDRQNFWSVCDNPCGWQNWDGEQRDLIS